MPIHVRDIKKITTSKEKVKFVKQVPLHPREKLKRADKKFKHPRDRMKNKEGQIARYNVTKLMNGEFDIKKIKKKKKN